MAEKAHQTLEEWIEQELDSDRAATTFYRLPKAERYNNNFERYPRLRAVALLSYLALVLAKQKRITKDLFWEVIERRYRLKGLTPPSEDEPEANSAGIRARTNMPGTPAGRPEKRGQVVITRWPFFDRV